MNILIFIVLLIITIYCIHYYVFFYKRNNTIINNTNTNTKNKIKKVNKEIKNKKIKKINKENDKENKANNEKANNEKVNNEKVNNGKVNNEKVNNEKVNNEKVKDGNIVYLEINVDGENVGKIVIKLFDDVVPKTCHNFKMLCGKKMYKDSPFHRIINNFMIQGGDFTNGDGTGGKSIFGEKFEDENFELLHDKPYLLSMANSGPNTNGSQFFITTVETHHLDGKHVVFGEVIDGYNVVNMLNNLETNSNNKPQKNAIIHDCGIM